MKLKNFLIPAIIALGVFVFWQYALHQKLAKKDISCGGDWSHMVKCPFGSYCRSLGQGPLVGGLCRTWFSSVFDIPRLHEGESQVPSSTTPTSTPSIKNEAGDWQAYKSPEMKFSVQYPASWETWPEKPVAGGLTWFIRTDSKEDISVRFRDGVYYEQITQGRILTFREMLSKTRDKLSSDPLMKERRTTIANITATEFTYNPKRAGMITEPDLINYEIYIPRNGEKIFTITAIIRPAEQKVYDPIFRQILSTFKVIESNQ